MNTPKCNTQRLVFGLLYWWCKLNLRWQRSLQLLSLPTLVTHIIVSSKSDSTTTITHKRSYTFWLRCNFLPYILLLLQGYEHLHRVVDEILSIRRNYTRLFCSFLDVHYLDGHISPNIQWLYDLVSPTHITRLVRKITCHKSN